MGRTSFESCNRLLRKITVYIMSIQVLVWQKRICKAFVYTFLSRCSSLGSSHTSRCMLTYVHTQELSKLNCVVNTNHSLLVCVRKWPALSIKPFPQPVSETVKMHGIIRQSNQGMWCFSWLKQIRLRPVLVDLTLKACDSTSARN